VERWTLTRVLQGSLGEEKAMAERRIWVSMSEPISKRARRNIRHRSPKVPFTRVRRRDCCLDADELADRPSVNLDYR
jgi:hypothetical protein